MSSKKAQFALSVLKTSSDCISSIPIPSVFLKIRSNWPWFLNRPTVSCLNKIIPVWTCPDRNIPVRVSSQFCARQGSKFLILAVVPAVLVLHHGYLLARAVLGPSQSTWSSEVGNRESLSAIQGRAIQRPEIPRNIYRWYLYRGRKTAQSVTQTLTFLHFSYNLLFTGPLTTLTSPGVRWTAAWTTSSRAPPSSMPARRGRSSPGRG